MENKELPTISEYMMTYLESQPLFPKYDRWIDFALGCPKPILFAHYEAVIENYAQLVAEYHVKLALEAASKKAIPIFDRFGGNYLCIDEDSILTAYKV